MIKNYFKIAWRNLVKNKVSSIINLLGLSLGLIACIIIYLVTGFELRYDKFHPDGERIYRLVSTMQQPTGETEHLPMVPDPATQVIRNDFTGIETIAAFHVVYPNVIAKDGGETKKFDRPVQGRDIPDVILAEPQYFGIFKYQWLKGTPSALNDPFKAVLTESKAHKYFGLLTNDEIIGKEVIYDDSLRFTVAGIVKDLTENSDLTFTDFLSYTSVKQNAFRNEVDLSNWMFWSGGSQTFVKLNKGTQPDQINAQLAKMVATNVKMDGGSKVTMGLQPLSDMHFNTNYEDMYARKAHLPTLYILMGIAAFILILATINFINLATAQSVKRSKEIGIRKVLGSNKAALIFQFLSETFILTLAAITVAILVVPIILSGLRSFIPEGVVFHPFNPATVVFLLSVCVITSLLAGFYPAKVLSAYLPATTLKGTGLQKTSPRNVLRKSLIVFQFSISIVFIIGTLIMGQQMRYLLNKDMGFKKDAIITLSPAWQYGGDKAKLLADKIRGLAGVQLVSVDMGTPADKGHWGTRLSCKETNTEKIPAQMLGGDENYLPLYQLKLVAGRNLQNSDSIKEFLVNESLVKKLGFKSPEDALGKMVESGMSDGNTPSHPIVGVIADFHTQSLHEPIKPAFMIESKTFCRAVSIKLHTKGKQAAEFNNTVASIGKIWKELYPSEKFEFSFFDQAIAHFYEKEQKTSGIVNLAMIVAIFISCMGLFGLAVFTAQQRTKEIGIRKVLGAGVPGIISLLSKDFIRPIVIAILIASPLAWYFIHKWLDNFAYRITIHWWVFLLAGTAAILIAFITVGFQTVRAAVANPVKSLRTE